MTQIWRNYIVILKHGVWAELSDLTIIWPDRRSMYLYLHKYNTYVSLYHCKYPNTRMYGPLILHLQKKYSKQMSVNICIIFPYIWVAGIENHKPNTAATCLRRPNTAATCSEIRPTRHSMRFTSRQGVNKNPVKLMEFIGIPMISEWPIKYKGYAINPYITG